jgi:hypothetical protein
MSIQQHDYNKRSEEINELRIDSGSNKVIALRLLLLGFLQLVLYSQGIYVINSQVAQYLLFLPFTFASIFLCLYWKCIRMRKYHLDNGAETKAERLLSTLVNSGHRKQSPDRNRNKTPAKKVNRTPAAKNNTSSPGQNRNAHLKAPGPNNKKKETRTGNVNEIPTTRSIGTPKSVGKKKTRAKASNRGNKGNELNFGE